VTSVEASRDRLPARPGKVQIALPSAPVACRLAREFVLSVSGGAEDSRVALVVTELVTNAVIHGHARPQLRVGWNGRVLEVEVEDDGPGRPMLHPLNPLNPLTTSGRGLALVDQIADDWGVEARGGCGPGHRKVVWARIDLGE
jgi:anti-sigma regulatory factor (Ser/Thr protein kinase)